MNFISDELGRPGKKNAAQKLAAWPAPARGLLGLPPARV
jgi:hypothetical protein